MVRMLASALGKRERTLVKTSVTNSEKSYALGFVMDGQRAVLLLSNNDQPVTFTGPFFGWTASWDKPLRVLPPLYIIMITS